MRGNRDLPVGDRDEEPEGFTSATHSLPEGFIARLEKLAAQLPICAHCQQTFTHAPIRRIEAPFPDTRDFCSMVCMEAAQ